MLAVLAAMTFYCCGPTRPPVAPAIEFTNIPQGRLGGGSDLVAIEGRVRGAKPGQRIVLFAKSDLWWAQPYSRRPFTMIQPDQTWKSSTHFGTEYAALLVNDGYVPPSKILSLPELGGAVIARATVEGKAFRDHAQKQISFSGYQWKVRHNPSDRGGTTNDFDPANAWVDSDGHLHLKITRGQTRWNCAEVTLDRTLGYGSYVFSVREANPLEPAVVFSLYTWDPLATNDNNREMDIEISRWGDPASKDAQYVIQPYYIPANVVRFSLPFRPLVHSLRWTPGKADFATSTGLPGTSSRTLASYSFTSGVPSPGGELLYMGLYVYGKGKYPLKDEVEVTIDRFEYLP